MKKIIVKPKHFTKVWTNKQVFDIMKDLREAGYTINEEGTKKDKDGHWLQAFCDKEMLKEDMCFSAMTHSNGEQYICSIREGLISSVDDDGKTEIWNG